MKKPCTKKPNLYRFWYLTLCAVVLCSHINMPSTIAQENQEWLAPWSIPEKPLGCVENIVYMERLNFLTAEEVNRGGLLIVIARLGSGEQSKELNRRRLYNVRQYLINHQLFSPQAIILAESARASGYGRVEFYLKGKLIGGLTADKKKDLCVSCCDIDERYYPFRVRGR